MESKKRSSNNSFLHPQVFAQNTTFFFPSFTFRLLTMKMELRSLFLVALCASFVAATFYSAPPPGCRISAGDGQYTSISLNSYQTLKWKGNSHAFLQFSGKGLSDYMDISDNVAYVGVQSTSGGVACKEYSPQRDLSGGVWVSNTTFQFMVNPSGGCRTSGGTPSYIANFFAWCEGAVK